MRKTRRILAVLMAMVILMTGIPFSLAEEMETTKTVVEQIEESTTAPEKVQEEPAAEPAIEVTTEPTVEVTPEVTAEPTVEPTVEVTTEPTVEPTIEVTMEPTDDETAAPTSEVTEEPTAELTMEPTDAPEETSTPEPLPSEEATLEPSAVPTEYPVFVPEKAPSKGAARCDGGIKKVPFIPVYTVEALAEYMDMSVTELADALEMDADALFALSPEEIAAYHEMLATPISTYANGGKISLGKAFGGYANTNSTLDYEIYISRTGRYLLNLDASKYMQFNVYCGSEYVDGVFRFRSDNSSGWTVDLEGGQTYTIKANVDGKYATGNCDFSAVLRLYIDGSYADRAKSLAYDVFAPFEVKYDNDFQIFCFTAVEGRNYRIGSTGSIPRKITVCDAGFNEIKSGRDGVTGSSSFDVTLTPGNTYYLKIEGKSGIWYYTGSGEIKIQCLDQTVRPVTFTKSKSSVNPGFDDSVTFNVSTQYASKVRLLVDGAIPGAEHAVSGGKASFSQSFHVSGVRSVQVQGYYNGSWSLLSDAQTVTVNNLPNLGTPVYSSISNNQGTAYQNRDYTLKWNPLANAVKYSAYVYSGDEEIYKTETEANQVTIPANIFGTLGVYHVDVYGMAKRGQQSNPGARAEITVVEATNFPNPTVDDYDAYPSTVRMHDYIFFSGVVDGGGDQISRMRISVFDNEAMTSERVFKDYTVNAPEYNLYDLDPIIPGKSLAQNGELLIPGPGEYWIGLYVTTKSGKELANSPALTKIAVEESVKGFVIEDAYLLEHGIEAMPDEYIEDFTIVHAPDLRLTIKSSNWINIFEDDYETSELWIEFDIDENRTKKSREGYIEISAPGCETVRIRVYQHGTCPHQEIGPVYYDRSGEEIWDFSECPCTVVDQLSHGYSVYISKVEYVCQYCDAVQKTVSQNKTITIKEEHYYDNGKCVACGISEANSCKHPNYSAKIDKYEQVDGKQHYHTSFNTYTDYVVCKDCGCLGEVENGIITWDVLDGYQDAIDGRTYKSILENHSFVNDQCVCGYVKQAETLRITGKSILLKGASTDLKVYDASNAKLDNKKLNWSSDNKSVATVSRGKVTAKSIGRATITAEGKDGAYGTFSIEVLPSPQSVVLYFNGKEVKNNATVSMNLGDMADLKAIVSPNGADPTISWTSSNSKAIDIIPVGANFIYAIGRKETSSGVTVTAKTSNGKTTKVKIKVVDPYKPATVTLAESGTVTLNMGETLQLHASVTPDTALLDRLTWSSSSSSRAAVDKNGIVTPKAEGTVTITVKTPGGKKDTVKVKIVDPYKPTSVTLEESGTVTLYMGKTLQLHAQMKPTTAQSVLSWSSSSKKYATVDENGIVTPVREGTTTITVKTYNSKKDTVKVKVVDPYKPATVTLAESGTVTLNMGETLQLHASVTPDTALLDRLTWSSSSSSKAAVDKNGIVTPKAEGTVTITVKTPGGKKDTVKVKVVDPYKPTGIVLDDSGTITIATGDTVKLGYKLKPDTAQSAITWTTSNSKIATVDAEGNVRGMAVGTVTITAKTRNNKRDSVKVKVVKAETPLPVGTLSFDDYTPGKIVEVDISRLQSGLNISWHADNAASYDYTAILMDQAPTNAENESAGAQVLMQARKANTTRINIPQNMLVSGKYVKLAVCAYGKDGKQSNYPWIGFRIVDSSILQRPTMSGQPWVQESGFVGDSFTITVAASKNTTNVAIAYLDGGIIKIAKSYMRGDAGVTITDLNAEYNTWMFSYKFSIGDSSNEYKRTALICLSVDSGKTWTEPVESSTFVVKPKTADTPIPNNPTVSELAELTIKMLFYNETDNRTGLVNKNDRGAVSIGMFQWRGNRALNLLRSICTCALTSKDEVIGIIGNALYVEIMNDETDWSSRMLTTNEASVVKKLLVTDAGINEQTYLAHVDAESYINAGKRKGFTNPAALLVYADIVNLSGVEVRNRVAADAIKLAGGKAASVTAQDIFDVYRTDIVLHDSLYDTRRTKVKNFINSLYAGEITGDTWGYVPDGKPEENTTIGTPVFTDELPSSINSGDTITLKWNKVTGADKYQINYSTADGKVSEIVVISNVNTIEYTIPAIYSTTDTQIYINLYAIVSSPYAQSDPPAGKTIALKGSGTSSAAGVIGYAKYTGVDYTSTLKQLLNNGTITQKEYNNRILLLTEAQKICTVIWTPPVTFHTWQSSEGEYNSNTDMVYSGTPSSYDEFCANVQYVGIPYVKKSGGHNTYNVEAWDAKLKTDAQVNDYEGRIDSVRTKSTLYGIDCGGLVVLAYRTFDASFPHTTTKKWLEASYLQQTSSPIPGDLLLKNGHIMIYLGKTTSGKVAVFEATADTSTKKDTACSGGRYFEHDRVSEYNYYRYTKIGGDS